MGRIIVVALALGSRRALLRWHALQAVVIVVSVFRRTVWSG